MPRKTKYNDLVTKVKLAIKDLAPENCKTVEEAYANAMKLAGWGLCAPPKPEDYVYCENCGRPCWHGDCDICREEE